MYIYIPLYRYVVIFYLQKKETWTSSGHLCHFTVNFNRESQNFHPATGSVSAVNQAFGSGVNQLLADCITSTSIRQFSRSFLEFCENISHLGKRKNIVKSDLEGGYIRFREGICCLHSNCIQIVFLSKSFFCHWEALQLRWKKGISTWLLTNYRHIIVKHRHSLFVATSHFTVLWLWDFMRYFNLSSRFASTVKGLSSHSPSALGLAPPAGVASLNISPRSQLRFSWEVESQSPWVNISFFFQSWWLYQKASSMQWSA